MKGSVSASSSKAENDNAGYNPRKLREIVLRSNGLTPFAATDSIFRRDASQYRRNPKSDRMARNSLRISRFAIAVCARRVNMYCESGNEGVSTLEPRVATTPRSDELPDFASLSTSYRSSTGCEATSADRPPSMNNVALR